MTQADWVKERREKLREILVGVVKSYNGFDDFPGYSEYRNMPVPPIAISDALDIIENILFKVESLAQQRTEKKWRLKISKWWDDRYKCLTPVVGGGLCKLCKIEKEHDLSDLLEE